MNEGPSNVIELKHPKTGAKYWITGTYRVDSSDKVLNLLKKVEPDALAMEVCDTRLNFMENEYNPTGLKKETKGTVNVGITDAILWGTIFVFSIDLVKFLSAASKRNIREYKLAYNEAKIRNLPVIPIDLSYDKTVKVNNAVGVTPFELFRLKSSYPKLKENYSDNKSLVQVMEESNVPLTKDFMAIDTRNKYMASKLYEMGETHSKILGLVGASQLKGLEEEFYKLPHETQKQQSKNENEGINFFQQEKVEITDSIYVEPRRWREQWYATYIATVVGSWYIIRGSHRAAKRFSPYYGRLFVPGFFLYIFGRAGYGVFTQASKLALKKIEIE